MADSLKYDSGSGNLLYNGSGHLVWDCCAESCAYCCECGTNVPSCTSGTDVCTPSEIEVVLSGFDAYDPGDPGVTTGFCLCEELDESWTGLGGETITHIGEIQLDGLDGVYTLGRTACGDNGCVWFDVATPIGLWINGYESAANCASQTDPVPFTWGSLSFRIVLKRTSPTEWELTIGPGSNECTICPVFRFTGTASANRCDQSPTLTEDHACGNMGDLALGWLAGSRCLYLYTDGAASASATVCPP